MKTKKEIVDNWLPRYTKRPLEGFSKHILLTNFNQYVQLFADKFGVEVLGKDGNMPNATANGITIINFGMGSANAATIMDLLSAVEPNAVLFLGKCGVLKEVRRWEILFFPLLPYAAKVLPTTISRPRFLLYPPSVSNGQYPLPSVIIRKIITPVRFTRPTVGCGNLTNSLRDTCTESGQWP